MGKKILKIFKLFFIISIFIILFSINYAKDYLYSTNTVIASKSMSLEKNDKKYNPALIGDRENNLWNQTVKIYLKDDLWKEIYIYDASHSLMPSLHAAFELSKYDWQRDFSQHFKRFSCEIIKDNNNVSAVKLDRLHYLYLASQFLVLAESKDKQELIPENLNNILLSQLEVYWTEPAWQWDRVDFSGGMKERLLWKLNNEKVSQSYYRAIIDEELFTFAIAADLRAYEIMTIPKDKWSPIISEILDIALKVYKQEVTYQDEGGWLLQPGVWIDHPDYAYAGNVNKVQGMRPISKINIATDSSHSHRFPLWLKSMSKAYEEKSCEKSFYEKLLKGLKIQFLRKVIVKPTDDFPLGYRTNNFMDGWNGVYRWGHTTQTSNNGFGPYELSGSLIEGWWGFLEDREINAIFMNISNTFPLADEVISLYIGPNTTRNRHQLVTYPNYFTNGFTELNVLLMWKVSEYNIRNTQEVY